MGGNAMLGTESFETSLITKADHPELDVFPHGTNRSDCFNRNLEALSPPISPDKQRDRR